MYVEEKKKLSLRLMLCNQGMKESAVMPALEGQSLLLWEPELCIS